MCACIRSGQISKSVLLNFWIFGIKLGLQWPFLAKNQLWQISQNIYLGLSSFCIFKLYCWSICEKSNETSRIFLFLAFLVKVTLHVVTKCCFRCVWTIYPYCWCFMVITWCFGEFWSIFWSLGFSCSGLWIHARPCVRPCGCASVRASVRHTISGDFDDSCFGAKTSFFVQKWSFWSETDISVNLRIRYEETTHWILIIFGLKLPQGVT